MGRRKRKKNRSFFTIKEGVQTKRPAPPGKPERNERKPTENEMLEEGFAMRDSNTCGKEE